MPPVRNKQVIAIRESAGAKAVLVEMKHVTKIYNNGVVANDDVCLGLNKGEILAIVGENGAGKTTIMNILFGLEEPTHGDIFLNGKKIKIHNPVIAMQHGIGMLHQHFMLFDSMTVAENIVYNNEPRKSGLFYHKVKSVEDVRSLSSKYNLDVDPNAIVSDCPVGVQQRAEILKILYKNPEIIIFDEPSAVLTPLEVNDLLGSMRKLVEDGKSIILITHKLHEVMAVADRIVVMRKGKVVGERLKADTSIAELSYLMVGRQIIPPEIPSVKRGDEKLLEVKGLSLTAKNGRKILDNINIHIGYGEIVGISGVSGNGQSELVQCLFGLKKPDAGKIQICERDISGRDVEAIRNSGISLIPEDRYLMGSSKEATLAENVLMGNDSNIEFCKNGVVNWASVKTFTEKLISKFNVTAKSSQQKMKELSGGNAQKLIVAREMTKNAPLLIAYEPTRGIDIGAIEFIHNKVLEKRNNGEGVLLVSTELSEVMSLCDRIYVIYNGIINGEFIRGRVDDVELGLLMLGGKTDEIA